MHAILRTAMSSIRADRYKSHDAFNKRVGNSRTLQCPFWISYEVWKRFVASSGGGAARILYREQLQPIVDGRSSLPGQICQGIQAHV
eukprot:scaffold1788_cov114-Cylindrotheca_fusiformis.AAC.3